MSVEIMKSGSPGNPYSKDIAVIHGPEPTQYFCQVCPSTFTKQDRMEARQAYLNHQKKVHHIKHPLIHSFDEEEADEYWIQDYL